MVQEKQNFYIKVFKVNPMMKDKEVKRIMTTCFEYLKEKVQFFKKYK